METKKKRPPPRYTWRLVNQEGRVIVVVHAGTDEEAMREASLLASLHVQDGAVALQRRNGKRYEMVVIFPQSREVEV